MYDDEEAYTWHQDIVDWERRQDMYERLGIDQIEEPSDEWEDGIPPEIQELIDWY